MTEKKCGSSVDARGADYFLPDGKRRAYVERSGRHAQTRQRVLQELIGTRWCDASLSLCTALRPSAICVYIDPPDPNAVAWIGQLDVLVSEGPIHWILGIWQRQQYYRVKADYDPTSMFLQKHTGNPATSSIPIFEDAVVYACSKAIKPLRGMERMKAIGLWIVLCSKRLYHNWKNPTEIARYVGIDPKTCRKLVSHLNMLGLVYYDHERQIIAVSRFPTGICEALHPFELIPKKKPWIYFNTV